MMSAKVKTESKSHASSVRFRALAAGFLDGFASMGRVSSVQAFRKSVAPRISRRKSDWQAIQDDFACVFLKMRESGLK